MQFGRLMGTGLMVLGLLLICIQAGLFFGLKKETTNPPPRATPSTPRELPIPGILGGVFLVGGAIVFLMARRRDEPDPAHAIK
jgi:uncharacterized membrane protein YfcA